MKYVEVQQFGGPDELKMIDAPDPTPQAGQVVIDVKAIGVNFADIMAREGTYAAVPSVPFRPGYEVAGVVSAVGDGVDSVRAGDRVMGIVLGGGYTTAAVLPAAMVIPLPETLEFGTATALLIQGLTAYFILEAGNLSAGKSVLIPGAAGGVGQLAIQIAKLKGAGQVIGLASPSKHELVRSLGADIAIDYTQSGWSKLVLEAIDGKGVDLFLDSQGDLTGEGFDALGEKAQWLIFGSQAGSRSALAAERVGMMVGRNITLRGFSVIGSLSEIGRGIGELIGWVTSGQLKIDVQRFPFAEVAKAQEAISNRQTTGKVVLEP